MSRPPSGHLGLGLQRPRPAPQYHLAEAGSGSPSEKNSCRSSSSPNHGALEETEGGGIRANPDLGSRATSPKLTKTSAGSTQLREALSKNDPFDHKATISGIIVLAILKSVCANVLGSLIQSLCDISVP